MILLMRRKEISEIVLVLILTGFLTTALNIQLACAEPRTWTVDDDGPADFHTIQEAVNAASPGDVIYVRNGSYYEHVVVNKALSLVGENRSATVIDGKGTGTVMKILASHIIVSGFTIRKSPPMEAGIWICANYCVIAYNNVSDHYTGFQVEGDNNMIFGNNIANNAYGIWVDYRGHNSIFGNNVTNNDGGIGIDGCWNNIFGNSITANDAGIGLQAGSAFSYVSGNNITNNVYGIMCDRAFNNSISGNNISNNAVGIITSHSDCNRIYGNNITGNTDVGISLDPFSDRNIIYHNNFIDNMDQVNFPMHVSNNTWDDGYPSGGNYWSDYTGVDLHSGPYQNETGSDGIGDTPYIVNSNNIDHYPLMNPYKPLHNIAIIDIASSKTVVGQGCCTSINITIANQGDIPEIFLMITYANKIIIQTHIITLTNNTTTTITFAWNTTAFAYGYYTICAYALPILGELNKTDNTLTDGTVLVTVPGDINGNCLCDIQDISILVDKFLTRPPNPLYDPNCDVNDDLIIDMADISIAIDHFLQEFTP